MPFDRSNQDPGRRAELTWAVRTGTAPPPKQGPPDLTRIQDRDLLGELVRRGGTVNLSDIPDSELWREVGRRRQSKRKVHRGGPGRPPKPRCVCGKFTQDAARRRGHVCERAGALA